MDNSSKFSKQLLAFIQQAKTDNLKTKHFAKTYKETKVKPNLSDTKNKKALQLRLCN
jgi:hypothetical protein